MLVRINRFALIGWHMKLSFPFVDQVGDLGYASELGNYAEYSGAPNEEEVLHYARVVLDVSSQYNLDHIPLSLHQSFLDQSYAYLLTILFNAVCHC